MGVERTDYIIYGFKMNPKEVEVFGVDIWDNKFLPYIEGHQGVQDILVNDAMNGEYLVFGKLINKQESGDEGKFTVINYQDFFDDQETNRITNLFKKLFGIAVHFELANLDPEIYVFSHYH